MFIVGFPRSGTKLIRDLLNNHSKIFIPTTETNLLPYLFDLVENFEDLSDKKEFKLFYNKIIQTTYFLYKGKRKIKMNDWYEKCNDFTASELFKIMILHDLKIENVNLFYWGDKSPLYLKKINLIKKMYPSSKVIHIVRDVRDVCLSHKRTWGKNIYRVAQNWNNDLREFNKLKNIYKSTIIEIKYESLLLNPLKEIKRICDFLNIDYEENMEYPSRISEKFGDAKDKMIIKKDNMNKFLDNLSKNQIMKIESICKETLSKYDYDLINKSIMVKRLSKIELLYYTVTDTIIMLIFRLKNKGLCFTIKFNYYFLKNFLNQH